jgi:hypothetical protein
MVLAQIHIRTGNQERQMSNLHRRDLHGYEDQLAQQLRQTGCEKDHGPNAFEQKGRSAASTAAPGAQGTDSGQIRVLNAST